MNHRPTCSQCKSEDLETAGEPIRTAGKVVYPQRCKKCGFFRSADKPLTLPPPVHASAETAPVATSPAVDAAPPAAEPPVAPAPVMPVAPAPAPAPAKRGLFGRKPRQ